jgi:hypothetical protein
VPIKQEDEQEDKRDRTGKLIPPYLHPYCRPSMNASGGFCYETPLERKRRRRKRDGL